MANLALVSGLWFAYRQLREDRRRTRVQTTLEAQLSLISGEAGAARRRLADYGYREALRRRLYVQILRPSWADLAATVAPPTGSKSPDVYGRDLLSDVFLFSRSFERVWTQLRLGILDDDLAFELFGWDAIYWHVFFGNIDQSHVSQLAALNDLATWVWSKACTQNFAQGGLNVLAEGLEELVDRSAQPKWNRDLATDFARQNSIEAARCSLAPVNRSPIGEIEDREVFLEGSPVTSEASLPPETD